MVAVVVVPELRNLRELSFLNVDGDGLSTDRTTSKVNKLGPESRTRSCSAERQSAHAFSNPWAKVLEKFLHCSQARVLKWKPTCATLADCWVSSAWASGWTTWERSWAKNLDSDQRQSRLFLHCGNLLLVPGRSSSRAWNDYPILPNRIALIKPPLPRPQRPNSEGTLAIV